MTEGQLWTAVSAGLLTSGQMTRALQQFGLEAKTPKDLQALLLKQALEGSMSVAAAAADEAVAAAAADEAARVKAQAAADETARVQAQAATAEAAAAVAQAQEIHLASLRAAAAAAAAELAAAEAAASAPAPPTSPMPTHARPGQGSPQSVVEVVPVEEGIDAVLSPFGGSTTVPRAIQGTAPTDPLPDAYRRGVLRQLDLNFLRSLAKKPDLAVASRPRVSETCLRSSCSRRRGRRPPPNARPNRRLSSPTSLRASLRNIHSPTCWRRVARR
jgi:hypothetical protein